jgi:hypothetical protein
MIPLLAGTLATPALAGVYAIFERAYPDANADHLRTAAHSWVQFGSDVRTARAGCATTTNRILADYRGEGAAALRAFMDQFTGDGVHSLSTVAEFCDAIAADLRDFADLVEATQHNVIKAALEIAVLPAAAVGIVAAVAAPWTLFAMASLVPLALAAVTEATSVYSAVAAGVAILVGSGLLAAVEGFSANLLAQLGVDHHVSLDEALHVGTAAAPFGLLNLAAPAAGTAANRGLRALRSVHRVPERLDVAPASLHTPRQAPLPALRAIPRQSVPPPLVRERPLPTVSVRTTYFRTPNYMTDAEREARRVVAVDGVLYRTDGSVLNTVKEPPGPVMVMDRHGNLYVSEERQHFDIVAGDDVAAAGHVVVKNGKIETMATRDSGGYWPPVDTDRVLRSELQRQRLDLSDVKFTAGYGQR